MDNYSVLMSVYHKEKAEFLREALDSIWNQTVQTDDFILVCDGPLNEELDSVIAEHEKAHPGVLHGQQADDSRRGADSHDCHGLLGQP